VIGALLLAALVAAPGFPGGAADAAPLGSQSKPALQSTPASQVGMRVAFEAPSLFLQGQRFDVRVVVEAPAEGGPLATWILSPGAFTVNGEPVIKRPDEAFVSLPGGARLEIAFDLAPFLKSAEDFELGFAKGIYPDGPVSVRVLRPVTAETDFMNMAAERLAEYLVLLKTTRGDILLEFWPEDAPGHVRNFLDLANSGFYADTLFHRVIPGFMIQGGDPLTKDPSKIQQWGTGNGPRMVDAEFNERRHTRGVLSAARRGSPGVSGPRDPLKNTASCQFFLCHTDAPQLDGSYTAFGKALSGLEVIDAIVKSPRDGADRPREPQRILSASVLSASPKRTAESGTTGN